MQPHLWGNLKITRLTLFMLLCTCVLMHHQLSLQINVGNDSESKMMECVTTSGFPKMVPFRQNKKVTIDTKHKKGDSRDTELGSIIWVF